ncbi:unnamed protein product [Auanema sp. JU1783]|nr:unnamed protein product [Auanema sp. JU1783]
MGDLDDGIKLDEDDLLNSGPETEMTEEDHDISGLEAQLAEIEEEQKKLKQIQSDIEGQMSRSGSAQISNSHVNVMSPEEKAEADARSVYVGNVEYGVTAEELEGHFHGCGSVNRVTILCDKFTGHPKGFAYIEFADREGAQHALTMSDSLLKGRQIKVNLKRTNKPGISTTNRPPRRGIRGRGVVVRYVYPGFRPRGRGRRRPGFPPFM